MKTFSNRSNAARDARAKLGHDKISGVHFRVITAAEGQFAWEPINSEDTTMTTDPTDTTAALEPTPAVEPTPAAPKAPKAKKVAAAKAAKAPRVAKEKPAPKPLFLSEVTVDGVVIKASAKMPSVGGKTKMFSARWKTAGGNDNLGPWHADQGKAIEQAKVHMADGRQAWVISGYR